MTFFLFQRSFAKKESEYFSTEKFLKTRAAALRSLFFRETSFSPSFENKFLRGLASGDEPISGFFKLQKIRTGKNFGFQN